MKRNLAVKARLDKIMQDTNKLLNNVEGDKPVAINLVIEENLNNKREEIKKYDSELNQKNQTDCNLNSIISDDCMEYQDLIKLTTQNQSDNEASSFTEYFSSGSSDNYIPNSELDTFEDSSSREKYRHKKIKKHVTIPQSSESGSSLDQIAKYSEVTKEKEGENIEALQEPEQGPSNIKNKRKVRKSLKERREERRSRLVLRNAGKCYVTKLGKLKPGRNLTPLTDCRMKCKNRITHDIREYIFKEYWNLGSYDERAKYTERFINIKKKKTNTIEFKRKREYANTYKIIHFDNQYDICKGCLLKTLGETSRFLQTVCEKIIKYGRVTKSERGRAASYKKISEDRLIEVEKHILKFPAYESHYSRSKSARKYLSADLNLEAMYRLYTTETDKPVSKTIYSRVFKNMNLSFKKPSVDTCNKCNLLQNKLKYIKTADEITEVRQQLSKHQEDYESAYNEKRKDKKMAQTNECTSVIAFDLQQCLPTPMLNTQSAFYKRQLWVFNLTIHDFKTNNAYCYMWPESSGGRGANQIASCLYDFIIIRLPLLHPTTTHLIMYSDSCSGQNKNSIVTTALMLAIKESEQLSEIEHKFLVPGHTHMEVDSDHALIEKTKKKTSMNIHHPRDWYQLVRTASNRKNKFSVIEMSENDFYDFSKFTKQYLLIKKFNTAGKKFIWSDVRMMKFIKNNFPLFQYKESYTDEEYNSMNYSKRNKEYDLVTINTIEKCYDGPVPISVEKKRDLMSLLEYIDPDVHDFYHQLKTHKDLRDIDPDIESGEEN